MLELSEHIEKQLYCHLEKNDERLFEKYSSIQPKYFQAKRGKELCFNKKIDENKNISLVANYYVGIDWLLPGEMPIFVEPKVNGNLIKNFLDITSDSDLMNLSDKIQLESSESFELNILAMLTECMAYPQVAKETSNLLFIDWEAQQIPIKQKQDHLSPFLIVQFLRLLQIIVRKGLRRSYYKVESNLTNRIKGKILVGRNIKENVLKNKYTDTVCSYETFGLDSVENRFLRRIFEFSEAYIENHEKLFGDQISTITLILNYCRSAFDLISPDLNEKDIKLFKPNPFFKEYEEAVKIGKLILKRYSYSISNTSSEQQYTPPYWIDMPKLFELYVYSFLKNKYPKNKEVQYQFSTYGNALDFLLNTGTKKTVIDAKYKLAYSAKAIHQDIRQVSGYARLKKVYKELEISEDVLIDCVIIYPNNIGLTKENFELELNEENEIKAYRNVYKIGIKLPLL